MFPPPFLSVDGQGGDAVGLGWGIDYEDEDDGPLVASGLGPFPPSAAVVNQWVNLLRESMYRWGLGTQQK